MRVAFTILTFTWAGSLLSLSHLIDVVSEVGGALPLADWQVKKLERYFSVSGYPDPSTTIELARSLDTSVVQIQVCCVGP